jgi:hypothetical protein
VIAKGSYHDRPAKKSSFSRPASRRRRRFRFTTMKSCSIIDMTGMK